MLVRTQCIWYTNTWPYVISPHFERIAKFCGIVYIRLLMQQNQNISLHFVSAFQMIKHFQYFLLDSMKLDILSSFFEKIDWNIERWVQKRFNWRKKLNEKKENIRLIASLASFHFIQFAGMVSKVIVSNVRLSWELYNQMACHASYLEYKHKHKVI